MNIKMWKFLEKVKLKVYFVRFQVLMVILNVYFAQISYTFRSWNKYIVMMSLLVEGSCGGGMTRSSCLLAARQLTLKC
jgi:hypothetical protein